ncbi:TonB-dependent siderophore receptor [Leptolyngbya sp. AN02str]|uniref:TonB-dependent siderophore receptor n=1 Tax=Leptolyngbya sp. AN02str TaxID=3423363 RepID=UPI003D317607
MHRLWFSVSVRLALMVALVGSLVGALALPGWAQDAQERDEGLVLGDALNGQPDRQAAELPLSVAEIPQLSELEQPTTTIEEWMAQIETSLVQITGVRLEETEAGLQIVLEAAEGHLSVSETRSVGNALIVDIANATLAEEFSQANPSDGIALVSVSQLPGDSVRVVITGTDAPPVAEVTTEAQGLVLGVTQGDADAVAEEDAIQVVVTGEQDEGYNPSSTTTATRTETPLRDIPQSIQVIPEEVLRDQRADISSALLNAPSVRNSAPSNFDSLRLQVRGFFSQPTLNGIRDTNGIASNLGPDLTGIERIEVLQGPNSVLFGTSSPGGTVNFVTKRPLSDPYYFIEAMAGSFDFYRGEIDLSGPLDDSERVLYRLNASYRDQGFFTDFSETRNLVIAPVISVELGENTDLIVEGAYRNLYQDDYNLGLPATGTLFSNPNGDIPRDRITNEGELGVEATRIGYTLEHQFSENWSLNNTFRYGYVNFDGDGINIGTELLPDNRTLLRTFNNLEDRYYDYRFVTNILGRFSTGAIDHQLLFRIDLGRLDNSLRFTGRSGAPIDLFDPIYGQPPGDITFELDTNTVTDELGFVLQDQIELADNLNLLLSGRFDLFRQTNKDFLANTETSQSGEAFSPRVGIVYQPIPAISLYASYGRSFEPAIGTSFAGEDFEPTRGTQFEIGVKGDIADDLSATLALYDITQSNVLTDDPANPGFSIQTGEQQSQGIELSLTGEILPGWNVFASYAYNDARVTEDNSIPVGNRVQRTTPNAASLWTTYEIQRGNLQGLGFGLGLFYVGDRAGDAANTFEVPSYLTTDAAIFYERDRFRAALNFKNIFDVDYFENAFSRLRVSPGAPFTLQGTISWTF